MQVAFGRSEVGLFDKTGYGARTVFVQRSASLDVTVARLGPVRGDTESDDGPILSQPGSMAHALLEYLGLGHDVIRRHDQQYRIISAGPCSHCSERQRWRGVAAHRLEHNAALLADQTQLLCHHKTVFLVAHHQRGCAVGAGNALKPTQGRLQQRVLAHECEQLLWVFFPRQRPQACA